MPRRRLRWWQKRTRADLVRDHLEETFPEGSDKEKLKGLILCVRTRYRDDGNVNGAKREAIAERGQITIESVTEIVRGRFQRKQWPPIETVLKAVNATTAELEVAHEMYNRISDSLYSGAISSAIAPVLWEVTPDPVPVESYASEPVVLRDPTSTVALYIHEMDKELKAPAEYTYRVTLLATTAVDDLKTVMAKVLPGEVQEEKLPDSSALEFKTVEDFIGAIKGFRDLKGPKTYREMAKGCQSLNEELAEYAKTDEYIRPVEARSAAALNTIGKGDRLPNLQTVRAYIVGAGGDLFDLTVWELAWQNLAGLLEDCQVTRNRRKGA